MSNYEVVYNVSLLDDIHNYFPAILYDNGRFQNLTQIFHYVRTQMNSRFNLYSYGASLAQARSVHTPNIYVPPTSFAPGTGPANVILTPQSTPLRPIIPTLSRTEAFQNIQGASALLELLTMGLSDITPASRGTIAQTPIDLWGTFGDPVMVRPTTEVLARATETIQGSTLAEGSRCAICQDNITATDTTRRIRACHHAYHLVCIDQWFTRSVFCPTCRHDIRIPLTPPQTAAPVAPLAPLAP
jgi:hypothetical protein